MVDEITTPLSAAAPSSAFGPNGNGPGLNPASALSSRPNQDAGQDSEGVGRAITAIAVVPLLKILRLLSRLASRSLFAASKQQDANPISQDAAKPENSTFTVRDRPIPAELKPSLSPVSFGVRGDGPVSGRITLDASFHGTEPTSPKPAGKASVLGRKVT